MEIVFYIRISMLMSLLIRYRKGKVTHRSLFITYNLFGIEFLKWFIKKFNQTTLVEYSIKIYIDNSKFH